MNNPFEIKQITIMKRGFSIFLLGLALLGCQKQESGINGQDKDETGSTETHFLSLSLVTADKAGTRAPQGDYQDGEEHENSVSQVRFFFFDEAGQATAVWKKKGTGGYDSWIDRFPSEGDMGDGDADKTVEKILNATLGLDISGDNYPAMVLAVLNPTPEVLALSEVASTADPLLAGPSLGQLRTVIADYRTGLTGAPGEGGFVMSNSVYVDKDGNIVETTELGSENFALTVPEAQEHPVILFVERVLARIDLSLDINEEGQLNGKTLADGSVIYRVSSDPYKVDDKDTQIYARLLGWNITGTPDKSRLVKKVSAAWPEKLFGDVTLWNTSDYHRSFWAVNPDEEEFAYLFGNFSGEPDADSDVTWSAAAALKFPETGKVTTAYMQENAAASAETGGEATAYPTKVILAAQLVDENGKPYPLAEWNYKKYRLSSLKDLFADQVLKSFHKRTGTDGNLTFTKIKPEDLTFKTAAQHPYGDEDPDDSGRYYVYAVLTDQAAQSTWTLGNAPDSPVLSTLEVNRYIRDAVNHVKVWNEGLTYYYFDIRHLGAAGKPGYSGVVRNHLYAANITKLAGLGTPVYNPGEVIYPESPESDESIVSAEVNILQWRIVAQDYEVTWP